MRTSRCKFHKALKSLLPILFLISLITLGLNTAPTYADSLTLSVSTNNLAVDLSSLSSTGDFNESSNMSINVSTSSTSGYTLSIASSTGSTDLTNQSDNTKKINSISSNLTNSDFSNSSNTQYNNKWGYKPSQYVTVSGNTYTTVSNTGSNSVFKPLPGTSGEIIARTNCANGTSPCTNATDNYTISIGARANNQTAIGGYVSDTFVITAVTNKGVIPCDSTKLCVEYNGNGLSYPETTAQLPRNVNNVNYNSSTTQSEVTKILHSDNVGDDGIATGNSDVNIDQTKEATIDGASSVNVSLYYDTEGVSFDWVALYAGADSVPSSTNDATIGSNGNLTGKLGGNKSGYTTSYTTWNLWNNSGNAINSDTIKIHFKTDDYGGSYISYGYYAIITGTGTAYSRTITSGEYATPTGTNATFYGWSSTQVTAGSGHPSDVEYADESEVKSKMPGDNTETKTLYAVWQQEQTITFNKDSNVSSIAVIDSSGTTVGTITTNGQTLNLLQGDTYTLKPTHTTGYGTNTITKTTGAGTLSGREFTVGAGTATINITSKAFNPIQNYDCSSLSAGGTEEVYDTRDNEVYLIGKLADNNCWMLDNLRLDITNSTIMNGLTTTNTHVDANSLTSLKSGNRSAGNQYASSGFVKWDSINSSNVSNLAKANADYKDTVASVTYGEGSGKIGVYYNYCAASAGSYCYDSGAGTGNASYDLCPAGWRMPTGSDSGEYNNLYTNGYSSNATNFRNALSTPLSGRFIDGSAYNQGYYGYFWSSTYNNSSSMYYLFVNSSYVSPSSGYNHNGGGSLRCVRGSS